MGGQAGEKLALMASSVIVFVFIQIQSRQGHLRLERWRVRVPR